MTSEIDELRQLAKDLYYRFHDPELDLGSQMLSLGLLEKKDITQADLDAFAALTDTERQKWEERAHLRGLCKDIWHCKLQRSCFRCEYYNFCGCELSNIPSIMESLGLLEQPCE